MGIDNDDIYAMSGQLSRLLYKSTAGVMVLVILWIMMVARRTTRPILALQKHMRKVSKGNLEPHAGSDNGDDISDLADDFNHMIEDLKEKRARLIKAEKDAAWREMAAQISHDIKNTLTPITLSVDLLKQAGNDDAANYKDILKQTLEMIDSQVKNLQEIAIDFFEFTGGRKSALKECDLELMISEVLDINRAWANELGITLSEIKMPENVTIIVLADMMKLHRVLTNLVTNAFQAMPEGGALNISLAVKDNWAVLKISDNGVGIPDDVREHLFEPYFTTRSKGTGLGLAISRRVIEDIHGTITLEANKDAESGTTARICLPVFKEEAPPPKEGLY
ncbi:MAG: HAMP domain-containing histidine kinase [bacterium]|nr:HAMP domain-containing histidine kinase [bacterium]